jgi:hypothetical protein
VVSNDTLLSSSSHILFRFNLNVRFIWCSQVEGAFTIRSFAYISHNFCPFHSNSFEK